VPFQQKKKHQQGEETAYKSSHNEEKLDILDFIKKIAIIFS